LLGSRQADDWYNTVYVDERDWSDIQVSKKFKKWFKRPEWIINIFSLTALRLGLFCSYFLVSLLALLFFLLLTNTRHPVDGAEDIIIFKDEGPPQGDFNIFNWLLIVL
jgi:hypothetical protein